MKAQISDIVIHAGLHKTATTSIQLTLHTAENQSLLRKYGFWYPERWPANHSVPVVSAFCDEPQTYHVNVREGYDARAINALNQRRLAELREEATAKTLPKLLLSGEDISVLSIRELQKFKNFLLSLTPSAPTIRVVIYVRNPVDYWVSTMQQFIKGGATFESVIPHIGTKRVFRTRIENLTQVFGVPNVSVYAFEDAVRHTFGPTGHLLSQLGFSHQWLSHFRVRRANESISLVAADILSFVNEKLPPIEDGKRNEKRSQEDLLLFSSIRGPKFDIPYPLKRQLFEGSQSDIQWLRTAYGIDYSFFPYKPTDSPVITLSDETATDIRAVFTNPRLSQELKRLTLLYVHGQFKNTKDPKTKMVSRDLLDSLKRLS